MLVDASAIVAILLKEPGWQDLWVRLRRGDRICVSPIVLWEATLALSRTHSISGEAAQAEVDVFVEKIDAEILDITPAIGRLAAEASHRYGRGRHKAGLNLGDCFAYAVAKAHDLPLLFKGDDFPHTDVVQA